MPMAAGIRSRMGPSSAQRDGSLSLPSRAGRCLLAGDPASAIVPAHHARRAHGCCPAQRVVRVARSDRAGAIATTPRRGRRRRGIRGPTRWSVGHAGRSSHGRFIRQRCRRRRSEGRRQRTMARQPACRHALLRLRGRSVGRWSERTLDGARLVWRWRHRRVRVHIARQRSHDRRTRRGAVAFASGLSRGGAALSRDGRPADQHADLVAAHAHRRSRVCVSARAAWSRRSARRTGLHRLAQRAIGRVDDQLRDVAAERVRVRSGRRSGRADRGRNGAYARRGHLRLGCRRHRDDARIPDAVGRDDGRGWPRAHAAAAVAAAVFETRGAGAHVRGARGWLRRTSVRSARQRHVCGRRASTRSCAGCAALSADEVGDHARRVASGSRRRWRAACRRWPLRPVSRCACNGCRSWSPHGWRWSAMQPMRCIRWRGRA